MKIVLRTFADLREIVGRGQMELSLSDGETVGGLLAVLCRSHPLLAAKLFTSEGRLRPHIVILKNGRNIASLQDLATPLAEGDVVSLFPPVAGG